MLNHDHDVASVTHPNDIRLGDHENERYYAEVPALALDEQSRLVDQVIRFAFETLGVRHLEVRVSGAEMAALAARSLTHGRGSAR